MSWQEVLFQYDQTFDGFLCCVYESYVYKEFPIAFTDDEECCSLYEVRYVVTVREHAQRVYRSLERISRPAAELVRRAFFTCLEEKECHLYALIRKLYQEGPDFLHNRSDEVYYPVAKAVRHMNGELEKLRGFVRFSDYHGVLGGEIAPKNRVLPLLRRHFCDRYANESFFLYDRTHRELLLYAKGKSRIIPVDDLQLDLPEESEVYYRTLWKRFFDTVSIEERTNPRCQNTFLPKRYRPYMTEFQQDTQVNPASGAALEYSAAPGGIPAPGTPRSSALSAPGSAG